MKTLKNLLYLFVAASLFAGCSDDDTITVGAEDDPNCYDVYFPSQENIADLELDPSEAPEATFIVRRNRDTDAITVPVTITGSEEGLFTATAIEFDEGQTETEFTVSFDGAEVGTTYTCEVNIDNPLYASLYTERATGFQFSVTRVKWVLVTGPNGETKGKWRDDLFSSLFNVPGTKYAEKEVEIYERADMPGYYRILDIYDTAYITALFGGNYGGFTSTYTILNATNPEMIYLPEQWTGRFVGGDGVLGFASNVPQNGFRNGSDYGKNENGVFTFPVNGVLVNFDSDPEGFYYGNSGGMLRIMLPGAKSYDYALTLTAGEPEEGKVQIGVRFGADVAKVKYAFYTGSTNDATVGVRSGEIEGGDVESKELAAAGTVEAEFEATGTYSMVANAYNAAGELANSAYVNFGYVAADDEKPVVFTCGINITDRYAPQGYTSEDSAEIYIYGENIVSGAYALVESEKLDGVTDIDNYMSKNGHAFTDAQLEAINGKGYSGVIGNLIGGTEYTLIVKAFNGYISKITTVTATTNGTPHPLKRTYTAADIDEIGGGKTELFKKWNYYAKCFNEAGNALVTQREYLGQVEFKENTTDDNADEELDAIDITGLTAHMGQQLKFDDTMTFSYEEGFVFMLGGQTFNGAAYNGFPLAVQFLFNGLRIYPDITLDYALVGGLVEEGYMAFVSLPDYAAQNVDFNGFLLGAFEDNTYASRKGILEAYNEIMLVDPAVDDKAPATGKSVATKAFSMHSLRNLAANAAIPNNFVELRGHERMRALINEMRAGTVRNVAEQIVTVDMPMLGAADSKVTFKAGEFPKHKGNTTEAIKANKLVVRTK